MPDPPSYNPAMPSSLTLLARLAASLSTVLALGSAAQAAEADDVPQRGGEPQARRIVQEDEHVRIEELRVRGQTQRVVVRPKGAASAPAYEILTGTTGRDPGGVGEGQRGATGQRVWNVLGF